MCVVVGDMMGRINVIIGKENLSLQKEEKKILSQKILLFPWLNAYLLQRVCDEIPNAELQECIEEYVFEISNADTCEKINVPEKLSTILSFLEEEIKTKDSISLAFDSRRIEIAQEDFVELTYEVIDQFMWEYFSGINSEELNVQIEKDFGPVFSNCVINRLIEWGNTVKLDVEKEEVDYQVSYGDRIIFESINEMNRVETIEINESVREGIPFIVNPLEDGKKVCKYMYFPFWNVGDSVEISVVLKEGSHFLEGKHKKSRIVSWMKV